jgi:hypothetical protein
MAVILDGVNASRPRIPIHARPSVRLTLRIAAILGIALGIETTILHLSTDPIADVRAYYDAGARLNAGQPLYVQVADTNEPSFYRYPPLLAIAFRPLALLPFEVAAVIWVAALVIAAGFTLRRLGLREPVLLVAAWLALPIMWALTIGQAHVLVTFLLALGAPWAVALAANLKLFPVLVAVYWIGRREWRQVGVFAGWMLVLGLVQLLLEPAGTLAYAGFLSIEQVGQVANVSLYAISPALWAASVVVLLIVAVRLAPTPFGWAAAVVLAVFATPRLLVYQLSTLVAGLGGPRSAAARPPDGTS